MTGDPLAIRGSGKSLALVCGRILTMDDDQPEAEALLAHDGRVRAVGRTSEIAAGTPPEAEIIDLAGRVVIPGFVDAHCHLGLTATSLKYGMPVHSTLYGAISELRDALARRASMTPTGEWIVGRGDFALARFIEERRDVERADLDAAVPDHPCAVFSGLHKVTLNTAALRVIGLVEGTAELPPGSALDVASGVGTELYEFLPLPRYDSAATATAIAEVGRSRFTARGVTSIAEIPMDLETIHALQALRRSGDLPTRVRLWLWVPGLGSIDEMTGPGLEAGFGDSWLALGGIKLFVDGAGYDAEGRTVADFKWEQDEFDEVVWKAHEANLQLFIHTAPTRPGAERALTSIERALIRLPKGDHRHRIEHVGDLQPDLDLLKRIRRDGVIPVTTPQFTWAFGDDMPETSATPLATLHRLGFRPPGNSDSTGTQIEATDPWHAIFCALTHRTRGGVVAYPEERISLKAALRMYTRDAAWACHWDDRGVLAPGYLADFAVLGADPFEIAPEELSDLPVDMTVIGGDIAWSR